MIMTEKRGYLHFDLESHPWKPDIDYRGHPEVVHDYISANDFVGADMARKYPQMGYTRARCYANYKGGRKNDKENDCEHLERGSGSAEKAERRKFSTNNGKLQKSARSACN